MFAVPVLRADKNSDGTGNQLSTEDSILKSMIIDQERDLGSVDNGESSQ